MPVRFAPERLAGLTLVIALHAALLYGLWQHRLIPGADEAVTLFVNFIAPPPPPEKKPVIQPPPEPKPQPVEKPQPRQIVAEAPVIAPTEPVVPPPPPAPPPPVIEAPAPPAAPIALSGELAVVCAERPSPHYPPISRRMNEEGTVVLRVELDENGRIGATRIHASSGHPRLDEAALAAVRNWRCTAAQRGGQPVRATALQPFKFILQGN
jgi:protein TonB